MKYRRLYISLSLALLLFTAIRVSVSYPEEVVKQGNSEMAVAPQWTEMIIAGINMEQIKLLVDGKEIPLSDGQVYADDRNSMMISYRVLSRAFSCSADLFQGERLVVEKNAVSLELSTGDQVMLKNGEELILSSSPVLKGDELFIPIEAIEKGLGYDYEWKSQEYTMVLNSKNPNAQELPPSYDYREKGRMPQVHDQGALGTCWAFASLSAMESTLLPEEDVDFSEDHMTLHHSFASSQNEGGDYTMSMAYLAAWQGPVWEESDPYGDGESPDGLEAVKHVQEIQILDSKDFRAIKQAVYFYGGVQSSLYLSMRDYRSESEYYNSENSAYCYIGNEKVNHDVVIVGWDDHYPKENFNGDLPGDGAFVCLNSWGDYFGDGGVFYVSYYDSNIGVHNMVYTGIEEADNYDHIYQTDLCGWTGQMGYGDETAFFANVYEAEEEELLSAVGFYATGPGSEYLVYVARSVENENDFLKRQLTAKGELKNAGYYTVPLDEEILLGKGERFAVIVRLTTPGSIHPIAIEYKAEKNTENVVLDDGEGYISVRGSSWTSAEKEQECNICLKAFTKRADDDWQG